MLAALHRAYAALSARLHALLDRTRLHGRRRRVPSILQMEAVECGAACVAMILAHHGLRRPLEELRAECGVSRDGSKASNMLKAARRYGLAAKGYRREPSDLRSLPMPAIVHWNFNHFVVLEGFRRRHVYLADPAQGPLRVSEEELDQSFTGVVLCFEPGPDFARGGAKSSLLRSLVPRLAGSRLGLLYVLGAGFALLVPGLVAPTFSRIFVDDVLVRGLESWVRPLLLAMGVTALIQIALTWLRQAYLLRLETKLAVITSAKFLWHVLRLPIDFFHQRYAGEIGNRVAINDKVAGLLSGELATTLLNLVVIVFYAALMMQYDAVLTLVSVAMAALNLLALKLVARTRIDLHRRLIKDRGSLMGVAMGGLQTIETLKAMGSEADLFARWAGHQAKSVNSGQKLALATQILSTWPPFLLALNTAVVLGLGGLRVVEGHLSIGMLIAFQALVIAFLAPVNRLVTLGGTIQELEGDVGRLDDVLRAEPDRVQRLEPPAVVRQHSASGGGRVKLTGELELRGVTFGYSRYEPPLLHDFDLHLRPGSRVALVGGSGCGKSTIARLVAGLYEPWQGEVLFDGKVRSELPRAVLTNSVAFVDQEIFLFEDSIRENLALWDRTMTDVDLTRAARDAAIDHDIAERPQGFASLVAEGGVNFSGGQRQRLEIARALAINPTILVMDEATSALDPATENIIDRHLRARGLTCLIIAHRLSTIRDCDEIVVLHRGTVVERGRHEDLLAAGGDYCELIAAA